MIRPRIHAHFAMTVDGKISTVRRTPSQFTSPADKARLHAIRAAHDAILAGRCTVASDSMSMRLSNPELRARRVERGLPAEPLRIVVSRSGVLDPDWKIFQHHGSPLLVFSTVRMPEDIREAIAPRCELFLFDSPEVPLPAMLAILRRDHGVRSLVCEGGGELLQGLARLDLLDEIHLTIAPVVFGGHSAPTLTGTPSDFLPEPRDFRLVSQRLEEGEWVVHFKRRRQRSSRLPG
jgi:riboflavin-specific deaminase-like protein